MPHCRGHPRGHPCKQVTAPATHDRFGIRPPPPGRCRGRTSAYRGYKIIRRNGAVVGFEPDKIAVAMTKAFLAVNGSQGAASARVREMVDSLTEAVVHGADAPPAGRRHLPHRRRAGPGRARADARGQHEVARSYVLYREERAQERASAQGGRAATPRRRC